MSVLRHHNKMPLLTLRTAPSVVYLPTACVCCARARVIEARGPCEIDAAAENRRARCACLNFEMVTDEYRLAPVTTCVCYASLRQQQLCEPLIRTFSLSTLHTNTLPPSPPPTVKSGRPVSIVYQREEEDTKATVINLAGGEGIANSRPIR